MSLAEMISVTPLLKWLLEPTGSGSVGGRQDMSIMGMRRKFARHLKTILWIILATFVIGIPMTMYYGRFPSFGPRQTTTQQAQEDVVAAVGKDNITRSQLDAVYGLLLQQQATSGASVWGSQGVPLAAILQVRYQALGELASSAALAQEARKRGLQASDDEVRARIEQDTDAFIKQLQKSAQETKRDPREAYRDFMASKGTSRSRVSEGEFRGWLIDLINKKEKENLRRLILTDKLQAGMLASIRVSDADLMASYDEVKMTPIVISFSGLAKRTEAEAKKRTEETYSRLKKGANFAALAKSTSDLPPSTQSTAFKDWLPRPLIRAYFGEEAETALFGLKPGEFTAPVKTPMAYVIFRLEAKRRQLPADFAKKKEDQRKQLLAQRQQEAWAKAAGDIVKRLKLEPRTPEIAGLKALSEGKQAPAMKDLERACETPEGIPGEVVSAICYVLGQYHVERKEWEKAKEKFDASLSPPGDIARGVISGYPEDIYLALGKVALEEKKTAEALEYFAQADTSDNFMIHTRLLDIYEKMGRKDELKREKEWLVEYRQVLEQERQEAAKEAAQRPGPEKALPTQQPSKESPSPAPPPAVQKKAVR